MYAVIALAITFVMYTVWLLSCFRPHMKQAWVGTLSWDMEDLHTLGWVVQWQATISAQGYPVWSLSCKMFIYRTQNNLGCLHIMDTWFCDPDCCHKWLKWTEVIKHFLLNRLDKN
jgi:hypothetical protein